MFDALGGGCESAQGRLYAGLYSSSWQIVEERTQSNAVTAQYVWSAVYVDCMIERDRNADGNVATGPAAWKSDCTPSRMPVGM